jgi:pyruvate/2-oxoglutarate dehydrogenase complex dihydrolipoamide acyltransferase (E2) component
VLLDVPQLEVEKITLEVDSLRAHVSVLAELANLVSLSVGADVRLARVKLEIVGVRAQALLKVRLEDVRAILEKALDTVAEHPEILEILGQTLSEVLRETLGAARATLEEALEGLEVGDTVDDALKGKLEEVRTALEDVLEGQGGEAQETLDESGRTVRRVVEESGSVVEQTLNQSGEVTEETLVGDASTTEGAAGEEEGEARATPAAERRARELGVDLSSVEGTGSGGRITVRDVQNAAQA